MRQMTAVRSSSIRGLVYDTDTNELEVHFHDGGAWAYQNVAPEMHAAFAGAKSVGKFFLQKFRPRRRGHKIK